MERSKEMSLPQYEQEKSARLWVVAILRKKIIIRWDLWQFKNENLLLPTGPIAITSHYHLNYQISKDKVKGTDGIAKSYFHLFSVPKSITKLQSSNVSSKTNWLEMICVARADYKKPDSGIIRQSIAQRNQMQDFLHTNRPLLPVPPWENPIATQNN